MVTFVQAESEEHIAAARSLFREYEKWLGMSLCFQNFEQEIFTLPGQYAAPEGRLLLAYSDEQLAGCAALRPLQEDSVCEMKRLFVRREFRGQQIGLHLIERLMKDAREIGYRTIRLDTFPPRMGKAVSLYESHGFCPIEPYYDNPHPGVLFMECVL